MLEKATWKEIEELRPINVGVLSQRDIAVEELTKGAIVKVKTDSGNIYLFEMVDPKTRMAHVVRCEPRATALRRGYLGLRKVQSVFRLGDVVYHGEDNTSRATHFFIISIN